MVTGDQFIAAASEELEVASLISCSKFPTCCKVGDSTSVGASCMPRNDGQNSNVSCISSERQIKVLFHTY